MLMEIILLISIILIMLVVIALGIFGIILIVSAIIGVPFVPTKKDVALKMIKLAEIKPGTKIIDLGSGAGRLLFLAEKLGATAVGYELNPFLTLWTKFVAKLKNKKIKIYTRSIYDADLSDADVVFTYLMPGPMKKLADKLYSELKPGAKIITNSFSIPNKKPIKKSGEIMVYTIK